MKPPDIEAEVTGLSAPAMERWEVWVVSCGEWVLADWFEERKNKAMK